MEKISERILDSLKGADLWIALVFLALGYACWRLFGTKKEERKVVRSQIVAVLVIAVLGVSAIWAYHFLFQREPVFSKNVTGILVMRIVGDDAGDSLQGVLREKLNAELQKEPVGQLVEVHASREMLDDNKGLAAAHGRARVIGGRLQAKLVIWGRKIGEKQFYPRLTVMAGPEDWSATRERTHDEKNITELRLPEELVDEPFYLIQFAAGYSYYYQRNYREALPHFKAALRRKGASPDELADLQFFTAFCDYSLSLGQRNMTVSLEEAIGLFEKAAKVYEGVDQRKWAMTQNNLGAAYSNLPTGDRTANLQKTITALQAAFRVSTEKDFPVDWATIQNNLGEAYRDLPIGDRTANLQKAITAYEAALRVYTEKDFPVKWATTQNNLGIAYSNLPTGDRTANLEKAITAYEAALRVYTEKDFPVDWATTQNNLGTAYDDLPTGDRAANLQKAITAYEAAQRVRTEKDFPVDWAMTQLNLGGAYQVLPTGDRAANLQKGITTLQAALRVYTEKDFPYYWAATQNDLGKAYGTLPTGDRAANLQKAITALQAALRVRTEKDFPVDWAETQNNLGNAYRELPTGDRAANLQKAMAAYQAALRVRTEKDFPLYWAETQKDMGLLYAGILGKNRTESLKNAKACFEAALRVYTAGSFPEKHRDAAYHLADVDRQLPSLKSK
jgi:tetratricopeptide (TPR) repeat protein